MDLDSTPTKSAEETEVDTPPRPAAPSPSPVFKECRKNHAANMGGHAVDGCGEYMAAATTLICGACGCHRNFHRRDAAITPAFLDFRRPGRKRSRTKFSQEQKARMHSFSEKLGWKMHKSDEAAVAEFCRDAGVARGVLKVWMHNNKNTNTNTNTKTDAHATAAAAGPHFHPSNNVSSSEA